MKKRILNYLKSVDRSIGLVFKSNIVYHALMGSVFVPSFMGWIVLAIMGYDLFFGGNVGDQVMWGIEVFMMLLAAVLVLFARCDWKIWIKNLPLLLGIGILLEFGTLGVILLVCMLQGSFYFAIGLLPLFQMQFFHFLFRPIILLALQTLIHGLRCICKTNTDNVQK